MKTLGNKYQRFQIGDLELNAGTVSLRREGEEIALPKLSFELLLCLARHAPNVVSTDVLMDEVWGKVVVGEETVKQRVTLLRKALGDSTSDPRYIAVVRGRGYRLLADVSPLTGEPVVSSSASTSRGTIKSFLIAGAVLAVIGISFLALTQNSTTVTSNAETGPEPVRLGSTDNSEAWEAYIKGRAAYRRWTRQDNETALAFYQRAVELDPRFALAIAGIANVNALRATEFGLGDKWIHEAIEKARQALELEPELPEALKALGICHVYKGQYQTALDYYRSVLRLDPDYDEAIFNIAEIMQILGRWDEAVKYQRLDTRRAQGLERLSIYLRDLGFDEQVASLAQTFEKDLPVSFASDANRSLHYLLNGDYEQARTAARRIQRAFPNAADGWLREGEIDLFAGDLESAMKRFQAAKQTAGGYQDYAGLRVAQIQLLEGDNKSAESLLRKVEASALGAINNGHEAWFHRWHLAFIHSLLGNHDEAVDWFEQAVNSGRRRYEWDELEPAFHPLNDKPRFKAAIQRQKDLRQEMKNSTAVLLEQQL